MNVSKINKRLLDEYLLNRDEQLIADMFDNSKDRIIRLIKVTLRNNGLDEDKCYEYLSSVYLLFYKRIKSMIGYEKDSHDLYRQMCLWVIEAVKKEIMLEYRRNSNLVSYNSLRDNLETLEHYDLVDYSKYYFDEYLFMEHLKEKIFLSESNLTKTQKDYICLYYGLEDSKPLCMQQIADINGVTVAAVQDAISRGLGKIRRIVHVEINKINQIKR